jgi:flagellin-like hook-associated protein FlgL
MSGIVLSASVRQNLLSLQSTADLLSTTQNRLATGNKVNSALDNPTNFFTAQGLNNRSNDINNLLDSIGNGVQVLQAANQGITSIQKLVDTAKSIANQALQAPSGYSTKASATVVGTGTGDETAGGATAADLTGGGGATGSKLDAAVMTFAKADGTSVAITVGGTAVAYDASAGTATVKSLDDLNKALSAAGVGVTAALTDNKTLTFTSTNDHASQTIAAAATTNTLGLTATGGTADVTAGTPVADVNSQNTRAGLISQYNAVIDQIKTTAQDSSFNGINLLNGDQLKLVFNETGKSTLTIQGVTFDPDGLGLKSLTAGTDFLDNANTNAVLDSLNDASSTLRSQASTFGSNLSIVQIRQDFNKNLINVLQTGASNLTLADTNEEAANSQALSTRQSIAVSALALANQSNQSVLQLLR